MEKYLLSIDVDGTLLNSKKKISLLNKIILKAILKNGHYVILNSGRPYQGLFPFIKSLHLFNYPIIASNGGGIYYINRHYQIVKCLYNAIAIKECVSFLSDLKPYLEYAYLQSIERQFFYHKECVPHYFFHNNSELEIEISEFTHLENIIGGTIAIKKEFQDKFLKNYKKGKYQFLNILPWSKGDYEFQKANVDKASTLLLLAEKLKIKQKNIISFGDELNDLCMLSINENGYLMKQSEHLKTDRIKLCPYSNEKSGLGKFIYKNYRFLL